MSLLIPLNPREKERKRERLMIVQPLVGIGDMVWHKPWIDHLSDYYDVILATKPTVQARHLFAGNENIVDILLIERSLRGRKGRHDGALGMLRLIADFKASGADKLLVLHHSARYGLIGRLAGLTERWGYGMGRAARWLNAGAFLPKSARKIHPTKKMVDFAVMNGFHPTEPRWQMQTTKQAHQEATAFLTANGVAASDDLSPLVMLGVGAMHVDRQWPPVHFARLIEMMRAAYPGIRLGIMGAPSEKPLLDAVCDALDNSDDILICDNPLDVAISLLARSVVYVGNDTSLLNIAAACGRPSIGVFAQSTPLDYNPHIKAVCVPDGRFNVPGHIATITPDLVFDAVCNELQKCGYEPRTK